MAKRDATQFCLYIFVVIYVFHENVMVEGAKVSHTTALKKSTTDLPTARRQVHFRRASCNCSGTACECTVRVNLVQINFNQLASIRIYYNPADVSLNLDVLLNGRVIYHTGLSARNPPPFCIAVPQLPVVMLCVRLYDIRLGNNSIRACVNFEVQLVNNPILVVSFDCIRVGANGVGIEKPSPSALVDGPDPVIAADDVNVLTYTGSDKPVNTPDNSSELIPFSESNDFIINNNSVLTTAGFTEQTMETSTPATTIASIDIVTLLTKKPHEQLFLNPETTTHPATTYKSDVSFEPYTVENISVFSTQASIYTTMPSDYTMTGNSTEVSESSDLSNYVTMQINITQPTKNPNEFQTTLEQNDNSQSTAPVTNTYITATEDVTHSAAISSDIDILIYKIKTLATSFDRLTTTSPLNMNIDSTTSVKSDD